MTEEPEISTPQTEESGGGRFRRWLVPVLLWAGTGTIVVLAVVFFVLVMSKSPPPPQAAPSERRNVEVIRIKPRNYEERLTLPARVEADRSVEVSAEIQARLVEWLVDEGERVAEGQEILRLDADDMRAQRRELQAARAAAEVERRFAERELERIRELAEDGIASDSDLDQAENRFEQAEVALRRVDRQLDVLDVSIDKAVVRAPFAGRLDAQLVEPGAVVAPGAPLGRIYDRSHCRVQVDVPDRYIPFLETDNDAVREYVRLAMPGGRQDIEAHFTVPGLPKLTGGKHRGVRVPAKVRRIAQAADKASNTFRVELRFENPGGAFREGLLGMAEIQFLVYPDAIVVPLRAIRVTDDGPRAVVVEEEDGKDLAAVRNIEPISIQADQVLVRDGLKAEERLVVSGGKGVVHGEEVRVLVSDGKVRTDEGEGRAYDLPEGYQPEEPSDSEAPEERP